jgi:hypothetical protein
MKGVSWPTDLEARLVSLWLDPTLNRAEAAARLGVSIDAATHKARKLGVKKAPKLRDTDTEVRDAGTHLELRLAGESGKHWTLIDREDGERVLSYPGGWLAHKEAGGIYVYCRAQQLRVVRLHRFIIEAPDGSLVDHANGNSLDNRRCNLRLATAQQNCWNSKPRGASGLKGVWLHRHSGLWTGTIRSPSGHRQSIGYFRDPLDAAEARDKLAADFHGEFAWLNSVRSSGETA